MYVFMYVCECVCVCMDVCMDVCVLRQPLCRLQLLPCGWVRQWMWAGAAEGVELSLVSGRCARVVLRQHIQMHIDMHMRTCMCTYIHTRTDMHAYIHTHKHTYIHYINKYMHTLHYITLHYITLHVHYFFFYSVGSEDAKLLKVTHGTVPQRGCSQTGRRAP